MSNKQKVALEAEAEMQSQVDANGDKLIVMKGPLSEIFTKALNVVFAKASPKTGEYVAMESQAIDQVILRKTQSDKRDDVSGKTIQVQNGGETRVVTPNMDGGSYTIYGVNKLETRPEDLVEVKKEIEAIPEEQRDQFALVVNACVPSANSSDATGTPVEYFQNLTQALESYVESKGGRVYRSMDAAMESIMNPIPPIYKNVAMEGFFDSVRELFTKKHSLNKSEIGWVQKVSAEVVSKVKKTYANPQWVQKNIKPQTQIQLNPRIAEGLVTNGKIVTPEEAIRARAQAYDANYDKRASEVQAFKESLDKSSHEITMFYRKNSKNAPAVLQFANESIKKIKVPDTKTAADLDRKQEAEIKAAVAKAPETIPSLTAEQVVSTANMVLKYLNYGAFRGTKPAMLIVTGDWVEEFFEDSANYDGEVLRNSEAGRYFSDQGIPEKVNDILYLPYQRLAQSLYSALALMAKSTKTETDL